MSYDYDADGNKVFYEPEDINPQPLSFDAWLDINHTTLSETFIEQNPEDFRTDEDWQDIDSHAGFQSYCDTEYDMYVERGEF